MSFKVVSQKGFMKGVMACMDRFNITKGAIQRSSNFLLTQRGALTVCDGTQVLTTGPIQSPIQALGLFVDTNFAVYPLAAAPQGATTMGIWQWGLTPVSGFTGLGSLALTPNWDMPQIVQFAGVSVFSLGNNVPLVKMTTLPALGGSFSNLGAGTSGTPTWQANHYYSLGQRIVAPDGNGRQSTWQVVNVTIGSSTGSMSNSSGIGSGGLSGTTEPNFNNTAAATKGTGQTAADGQIIWMCIKEDASLAKEFPPHGAAHIATHANALWAWNTAPATTIAGGSIDGPSVLRMSNPNEADSWPLGNTITVGQDDGTQGTGMATFTIAESGITPDATLVVFKDYSTYTVTGVFQAQNFAVNQVKTDMGCLASRSIKFATGFGIIRFCHLGFAMFDGINDKIVSEEIRPYIFADAVTPGVDFTRVSKMHGTLTVDPPLYVCSAPTTDGNTTRIFVYDLVMRAWMIVDYCNANPNYPITCMDQLRPPYQSGFNAVTAIADYSGDFASIRRWQNGDTTWDATSPPSPIQWNFRPPEVGEPGSRAYFRRANVRLTAPQAGQITGFFNIGEESQPNNIRQIGGAGPSSGTAPNVATTANYYGNSDLGVALDIHQTGPSLNGTYSGYGPANIEGVDYMITAKQPRPFGQRW